MQQESIRPISTYDNLSATKPKVEQLCGRESSGPPEALRVRCNSTLNGTHNNTTTATATATTRSDTSDQGCNLNDTSHSVAAVRAALIDAKCRFFGINNYDTLDAVAPTSSDINNTNQQKQEQMQIVPEHNYQNVPQIIRAPPVLSDITGLQPMRTTTTTAVGTTLTPDRSLRYGTTYEQIPLSDFDTPQPSQAVYMSTTVPQNMKGIKIAGRHTPTRNSLRHSRMIVVNNKSQHTIQETYTTDLRNLYLSRQLLIFQLAIGLLIVGLAIWILILAPDASILINPYLSGLSLLLASIAGLILLGRDRDRDRRVDYSTSNNNCYKVLLAESYVFSALALIFCCLALVCAAIEFSELTSTITPIDGVCGPATSSLLNSRNCTCLLENQNQTSETLNDEVNEDINIQSCEANRREWKYLLGFSMALNTLGILATFLYITIFICCLRNNRVHLNTSTNILP